LLVTGRGRCISRIPKIRQKRVEKRKEGANFQHKLARETREMGRINIMKKRREKSQRNHLTRKFDQWFVQPEKKKRFMQQSLEAVKTNELKDVNFPKDTQASPVDSF